MSVASRAMPYPTRTVSDGPALLGPVARPATLPVRDVIQSDGDAYQESGWPE